MVFAKLAAGRLISAPDADRKPGAELEPDFPIEFLVRGTPLSLQANGKSKAAWKAHVKAASFANLPGGHWATQERVAATLFYFPPEPMQGDVDNIVKLVLDALARHIYLDDRQVERVVVQKFEPGNVFTFTAPSPTLADAMSHSKPVLYVRISKDPFEELS